MPGTARNVETSTDDGCASAPTASLDALLTRWACANRDRTALRTAGQIGNPISFGTADAIVNKISLYFVGLGLKSGECVALQLANTHEAPLLILGLQRAGLVPAILPMLWRGEEISAGLAQINPVALISTESFDGVCHAELMRDAAATQLSVRFVFALGEEPPDGVMSLVSLFDIQTSDAHSEPASEPITDPNTIGLINWATGPDGASFPVPRSHSQLMSAGLHCVMECGLTTSDRFLNPYPLSSITGIAGMLAPWLITGGELVQYASFTAKSFLDLLEDHGITYTALPISILPTLFADTGTTKKLSGLSKLASIRPFSLAIEQICIDEPSIQIIDMHNIGNLALIPHIQEINGLSLPLALEATPAGSSDSTTPELLELASKYRGLDLHGVKTLHLRGASVPNIDLLPDNEYTASLRARANGGFIDSGFTFDSTAIPTGMTLDDSEIEALPPRFVQFGGQLVNLDDLENIYRTYPSFSNAAAIARPDKYLGNIIVAFAVSSAGEDPDLAEFVEFLDHKQIAPHKLPSELILVDELPGNQKGRFELETTVEIVSR